MVGGGGGSGTGGGKKTRGNLGLHARLGVAAEDGERNSRTRGGERGRERNPIKSPSRSLTVLFSPCAVESSPTSASSACLTD